jgi:hypothetical protein
MTTSTRLKFAACMTAILLSTAGLWAQSKPPSSPSTRAGINIITNNRKLFETWISEANDLVTVGSGFQAVDNPITINCPAPNLCTFAAEQNLQVNGSTSGNRWAICTEVDGNFMSEPLCPFLGLVSSDGTYIAGSFVQTMHGLSPGQHTVQTFVYSDLGLSRSIYAIVYRVYGP